MEGPRARFIVALASLASVVVAVPLFAQSSPVIDVGTLAPGSSYLLSVNTAGVAVGYSAFDVTDNEHAIRWSDGQLVDLGVIPGYPASEAIGVNDRGQIVGYAIDHALGGTRAVLWDERGATDITPPEYVSCAALGIDRKGDIVGQCGGRPVVWREGIVIPLAMPPGARFGSAHVINERGTIAGDVEDAAGNRLPVRWRDGVPEPLPLPAGASGGHAAAINDRDQIVGYVNTPSFYDPVLWDQGGVTPLAGAWGLISGYARGINNRGEIALHAFAGPITEYGAYIWRDGRLAPARADRLGERHQRSRRRRRHHRHRHDR
jgi:probable HAF family extracellular repeat protein